MSYSSNNNALTTGDKIKLATFTAGAGFLALAAYRYKVCRPEQMMVRTGFGIKNISVSKKGMHWPFQRYNMVSLAPHTYQFDLHNMSKGKVEFKLPVVFTIKPIHPDEDMDGFIRYANYLNDISESELHNTIGGIIEGETRGLTARLNVEEMFSGKDKFRDEVVKKIDSDLNKFGLSVENANIKEMADYDKNNKYFEYRKQRAIETANFEAQVDVAEAKRMGEIGVAEKEGAIRIATAEIERNAMVKENERNAEIAASNAALAKAEAEASQVSEVARIEAENNAKKREAELEREVYELKKQMEMEEKRSRLLTASKVSAEAAVAEAEGQAEAMKLLADAKFYQQSKEAEGIQVTYDARAEGLSRLYSAAGSDSDLVKYELGLDKELFKKLAEENAKAVQGLNPKINVWNTGSSTSDPMNPILNVVQSMAPMLDGLQGKLDFSKLAESTKALDEK